MERVRLLSGQIQVRFLSAGPPGSQPPHTAIEDLTVDERERIHLLLIDDAKLALKDVQAGRTFEADPALEPMQAPSGSVQCCIDARFRNPFSRTA